MCWGQKHISVHVEWSSIHDTKFYTVLQGEMLSSRKYENEKKFNRKQHQWWHIKQTSMWHIKKFIQSGIKKKLQSVKENP